MPTTIQVDEGTREALLRYASRLQVKLGRKVTFDEAIRSLIEKTSSTEEAQRKRDDLFGTLAGEEGVWEELEAEGITEHRTKRNPDLTSICLVRGTPHYRARDRY